MVERGWWMEAMMMWPPSLAMVLRYLRGRQAGGGRLTIVCWQCVRPTAASTCSTRASRAPLLKRVGSRMAAKKRRVSLAVITGTNISSCKIQGLTWGTYAERCTIALGPATRPFSSSCPLSWPTCNREWAALSSPDARLRLTCSRSMSISVDLPASKHHTCTALSASPQQSRSPDQARPGVPAPDGPSSACISPWHTPPHTPCSTTRTPAADLRGDRQGRRAAE
ncbi:hypothetical protein V8C86DRAFT_2935162, partial [Haematococcus lacustris]